MNRSAETKELDQCLLKAKRILLTKTIKRSGEYVVGKNPHTGKPVTHKYCKLEDILEVLEPVLIECGILLIQTLHAETIETELTHVVSSQYRGSINVLKTTDLPFKDIGTGQTYLFRYGLIGFFGIFGDPDKDVEVIETDKPRPEQRPKSGPIPTIKTIAQLAKAGENPDCISVPQLKRLYVIGKRFGDGKTIDEYIIRTYRIDSPLLLKKEFYKEVEAAVTANQPSVTPNEPPPPGDGDFTY